MTDDTFDDRLDELASASLDRELSADEQALFDAEPGMAGRVERLRRVSHAVADVPALAAADRDRLLAVASAEFDHITSAAASSTSPLGAFTEASGAETASAVDLGARRLSRARASRSGTTRPSWSRRLVPFASAAAVLVLVIAGISTLGGDDDDTTSVARAPDADTAETSAGGASVETTLQAATELAGSVMGDVGWRDLGPIDNAAALRAAVEDTASKDDSAAAGADTTAAGASDTVPAPSDGEGDSGVPDTGGQETMALAAFPCDAEVRATDPALLTAIDGASLVWQGEPAFVLVYETQATPMLVVADPSTCRVLAVVAG